MKSTSAASVILCAVLIGLTLSAVITMPFVGGNPAFWTKSGNPILSPSGWDTPQVLVPRVLYSANTFRMWYLGGPDSQSSVGYATSSDGIHWTKNSSPVLQPGPAGSWDSNQITPGHVLWNGTDFLMWYRGRGSQSDPGAFGLAVSSDGMSWSKYAGNPVMTPSSSDVNYFQYPYVIQVSSTLKMWFTERVGSEALSIYYATSQDGIEWKQQASPVLTPSAGGWDSSSTYSPTVMYNGDSYQMFYSGSSGSVPSIGYATSTDGVTWTKSSDNPVLGHGSVADWDNGDVDNQDAVLYQNTVMLYYSGAHLSGGTYSGYSIGLAQPPSAATNATSSTSTGPPTCVLATAISGSELAPLAQPLRNFRDNSIQKTEAGSQFLLAFNAWYYSFSPYFAVYIAHHPLERTLTKDMSYPLIGILYGAYYSYAIVAPLSPEAAAVTAGIVATILVGLVYVAPIAYATVRLMGPRKRVSTLRRLLAIPSTIWFAVSLLIIGGAYQSGSGTLMGIGTANVALSALSLGSMLGTVALLRMQLPANYARIVSALIGLRDQPLSRRSFRQRVQ